MRHTEKQSFIVWNHRRKFIYLEWSWSHLYSVKYCINNVESAPTGNLWIKSKLAKASKFVYIFLTILFAKNNLEVQEIYLVKDKGTHGYYLLPPAQLFGLKNVSFWNWPPLSYNVNKLSNNTALHKFLSHTLFNSECFSFKEDIKKDWNVSLRISYSLALSAILLITSLRLASWLNCCRAAPLLYYGSLLNILFEHVQFS